MSEYAITNSSQRSYSSLEHNHSPVSTSIELSRYKRNGKSKKNNRREEVLSCNPFIILILKWEFLDLEVWIKQRIIMCLCLIHRFYRMRHRPCYGWLQRFRILIRKMRKQGSWEYWLRESFLRQRINWNYLNWVLRRLFDVYKMFLLGLLLRWKLVIFMSFRNLEIIMTIE